MLTSALLALMIKLMLSLSWFSCVFSPSFSPPHFFVVFLFIHPIRCLSLPLGLSRLSFILLILPSSVFPSFICCHCILLVLPVMQMLSLSLSLTHKFPCLSLLPHFHHTQLHCYPPSNKPGSADRQSLWMEDRSVCWADRQICLYVHSSSSRTSLDSAGAGCMIMMPFSCYILRHNPRSASRADLWSLCTECTILLLFRWFVIFPCLSLTTAGDLAQRLLLLLSSGSLYLNENS